MKTSTTTLYTRHSRDTGRQQGVFTSEQDALYGHACLTGGESSRLSRGVVADDGDFYIVAHDMLEGTHSVCACSWTKRVPKRLQPKFRIVHELVEWCYISGFETPVYFR